MSVGRRRAVGCTGSTAVVVTLSELMHCFVEYVLTYNTLFGHVSIPIGVILRDTLKNYAIRMTISCYKMCIKQPVDTQFTCRSLFFTVL
jgi:hypothetical protein